MGQSFGEVVEVSQLVVENVFKDLVCWCVKVRLGEGVWS